MLFEMRRAANAIGSLLEAAPEAGDEPHALLEGLAAAASAPSEPAWN